MIPRPIDAVVSSSSGSTKMTPILDSRLTTHDSRLPTPDSRRHDSRLTTQTPRTHVSPTHRSRTRVIRTPIASTAPRAPSRRRVCLGIHTFAPPSTPSRALVGSSEVSPHGRGRRRRARVVAGASKDRRVDAREISRAHGAFEEQGFFRSTRIAGHVRDLCRFTAHGRRQEEPPTRV